MCCRVYKISPQGYHKWKNNPISNREIRHNELLRIIIKIHESDPGYGYRFIYWELVDMGIKVGINQVYRICSKNKIFAHFHKRAKKYVKQVPAHDDLLLRKFNADNPNKVWLTDATEHNTRQGKLYFVAVKDIFSNIIVGWSFSRQNTSTLWLNALKMALLNRNYPKGVIVHSDRGSQPNSGVYRKELENFNLKGSMGNAGSSADNAAMESFFSLLQKNVLNLKYWNDIDELRSEITFWVEVKYNKKRRQVRLNNLTPLEYDTIYFSKLEKEMVN